MSEQSATIKLNMMDDGCKRVMYRTLSYRGENKKIIKFFWNIISLVVILCSYQEFQK